MTLGHGGNARNPRSNQVPFAPIPAATSSAAVRIVASPAVALKALPVPCFGLFRSETECGQRIGNGY